MKLFNSKVFVVAVFSLQSALAQLTMGNDGGNKRASVTEYIGLAKVTIDYNRPGVKGRDGKIWSTPVAHYGLADLGFGSGTASPWRAGANENTTISFSHDVKIDNRDLVAGIYGFHIILGVSEDILIFSKRANSWGSFYYNPDEDILRVTVKHKPLAGHVEWLSYEFTDQTDNSAVVALKWEKRMIPFRIEVDVHKVQLASFEQELRTKPGFNWQSFVAAANYCLTYDIAPDKALGWADEAINARFVGQKNFQTLSTKASVLKKLNRDAEADALMQEAVGMGQANDLHQYARTLLQDRKPSEALKVFERNYRNNPNIFVTNVGMARGLSANGQYKKALTYLLKAEIQAPDMLNKTNIQNMLKKLSDSQDIN